MAILMNSSNRVLQRAVGVGPMLDCIRDYTIMWWFRFDSEPDTFGELSVLADSNGANDEFGITATTHLLHLICRGTTANGTTALTSGVWYHAAVVRQAPSGIAYLNGQVEITLSQANDTFHTESMFAGCRNAGPDWGMPGPMFNGKYWQAALTQAQVQAEMMSYAPVFRDRLWAWYPTPYGAGNRSRDFANGYHWTETNIAETSALRGAYNQTLSRWSPLRGLSSGGGGGGTTASLAGTMGGARGRLLGAPLGFAPHDPYVTILFVP